jgi:hypothetical protein
MMEGNWGWMGHGGYSDECSQSRQVRVDERFGKQASESRKRRSMIIFRQSAEAVCGVQAVVVL